ERIRGILAENARAFELMEPGYLCSSFGKFVYEPRKTWEAACIHGEHLAPVPDCRCGFYTFKEKQQLANEYGHQQVYAEVWLWGRVVEHKKGYRAQYMYVNRAWIVESDWGKNWAPRAEWLADRYGVPIEMGPMLEPRKFNSPPIPPSTYEFDRDDIRYIWNEDVLWTIVLNGETETHRYTPEERRIVRNRLRNRAHGTIKRRMRRIRSLEATLSEFRKDLNKAEKDAKRLKSILRQWNSEGMD
ncbi:MAG: hypothetical protein ACWGQW_18605, partial [bacterium]